MQQEDEDVDAVGGSKDEEERRKRNEACEGGEKLEKKRKIETERDI